MAKPKKGYSRVQAAEVVDEEMQQDVGLSLSFWHTLKSQQKEMLISMLIISLILTYIIAKTQELLIILGVLAIFTGLAKIVSYD